MDIKRQHYATEILQQLNDIGCILSKNPEAPVQFFKNGNQDNTETMINKLMLALPEQFFYPLNGAVKQDSICFIAKNVVLFACQEKTNDDLFINNFINFIETLLFDIRMRYEIQP